MAHLLELCAALGADLSPAPEAVVPSAELSGVHVSELSDPTSFLEGGELLLTTGMPLRLTGLDTTAYVSRLVRRGVLGLALGLGPVHSEVPPVLRAACKDLGLALLTVPPPTPFLTISRTYWGLIAQSGRQELSAALGAQRALVRASAGARPAETMVRRLSDVIDGWAVLLSADNTVLTVRPREREPQAEQVSQEIARLRMAGPHSSATFPLGDDDVVVYPLNAGGRFTGYLAAGCRRPMSRSDRHLIVTAAALLAPGSSQDSPALSQRQGVHAVLASLILKGDLDVAYRLMQEFGVAGGPGPVRLVALHPAPVTDDIVDEAVRRFLAANQRPAFAVRRGDSVLVVVTDRVEDDVLRRCHRWLSANDPSIRMQSTGLIDVDACRNLQTRVLGDVADLPPGTVALPETLAFAENTRIDLAPLRDYPRGDLVSAVSAYLRARGHWEEAARDLGVHRNTLRYRIGTASRVLNVDLDDPDVAAHLWLTLRRDGLA